MRAIQRIVALLRQPPLVLEQAAVARRRFGCLPSFYHKRVGNFPIPNTVNGVGMNHVNLACSLIADTQREGVFARDGRTTGGAQCTSF